MVEEIKRRRVNESSEAEANAAEANTPVGTVADADLDDWAEQTIDASPPEKLVVLSSLLSDCDMFCCTQTRIVTRTQNSHTFLGICFVKSTKLHHCLLASG